MQSLFIGGPWDGRLIDYKLSGQTLRVAERVTSNFWPPAPPSSPNAIREVVYVRLELLGYAFMVEEDLYRRGIHYRVASSPQIVLDLLMQGYRRPSKIYGDQ